jgi:hypothetical protein
MLKKGTFLRVKTNKGAIITAARSETALVNRSHSIDRAVDSQKKNLPGRGASKPK